jgi:hypothetical protein
MKFKNNNSTHIRVYPEERIKLHDIARELSLTQGADIKVPEVVRRAFNIPKLKDVLKDDAFLKRGKK